MRSKIWRSMALTAVLAVLLFAILSLAALYSFFTARTENALDDEARLIAAALEDGAQIDALAAVNPDDRVTLVAADGSVLFDSDAEEGTMENHLERPEIQQALENGARRQHPPVGHAGGNDHLSRPAPGRRHGAARFRHAAKRVGHGHAAHPRVSGPDCAYGRSFGAGFAAGHQAHCRAGERAGSGSSAG